MSEIQFINLQLQLACDRFDAVEFLRVFQSCSDEQAALVDPDCTRGLACDRTGEGARLAYCKFFNALCDPQWSDTWRRIAGLNPSSECIEAAIIVLETRKIDEEFRMFLHIFRLKQRTRLAVIAKSLTPPQTPRLSAEAF